MKKKMIAFWRSFLNYKQNFFFHLFQLSNISNLTKNQQIFKFLCSLKIRSNLLVSVFFSSFPFSPSIHPIFIGTSSVASVLPLAGQSAATTPLDVCGQPICLASFLRVFSCVFSLRSSFWVFFFAELVVVVVIWKP